MSEDQQQAAPIVVLVDDDEAVRNAVRFSLELDGFSVRSFTDGEALFVARSPPILQAIS